MTYRGKRKVFDKHCYVFTQKRVHYNAIICYHIQLTNRKSYGHSCSKKTEVNQRSVNHVFSMKNKFATPAEALEETQNFAEIENITKEPPIYITNIGNIG